MYRVKGTDAFGKECWLTAQGYWGEKKDSMVFTKVMAETHIREIRTRNRYLAPNDHIEPELEAQ